MTRLVIQLPALNEAATIQTVLRGLPSSLSGVGEIKVVVVDDGSTDGTGALAQACGAQVVRHEGTQGVGAAFRSGLRRAIELDADWVVTMDADGQFSPDDVPALLAPLLSDEADFVTASRFLDPALVPEMPGVKKWGNAAIARWLGRMTGHTFRDVSCGFRAYNREAFLRLNLLGNFTYTHEVFLNLAFAGVRIREVPVRVRGVREHGSSRVAGNVPRYAWQAAGIILATYRDYFPLRFFGRLAGVFFALGILALAFLAVHWLRTGAFTPFKAVGFAGGSLCGAGLLIYLIGQVAETQVRLRAALDETLYRVRRLDQQLSRSRSS